MLRASRWSQGEKKEHTHLKHFLKVEDHPISGISNREAMAELDGSIFIYFSPFLNSPLFILPRLHKAGKRLRFCARSRCASNRRGSSGAEKASSGYASSYHPHPRDSMALSTSWMSFHLVFNRKLHLQLKRRRFKGHVFYWHGFFDKAKW